MQTLSSLYSALELRSVYLSALGQNKKHGLRLADLLADTMLHNKQDRDLQSAIINKMARALKIKRFIERKLR